MILDLFLMYFFFVLFLGPWGGHFGWFLTNGTLPFFDDLGSTKIVLVELNDASI